MKPGSRKYSKWYKSREVLFSIIVLVSMSLAANPCTLPGQQDISIDLIRPYTGNPFYWQYNNEPVLLLGGSQEDNLYNHPQLDPDGLERHLDLLVESGGNYLRNTMSSRNPGNRYPFRQLENGKYDLADWDEKYWNRLAQFLQMTYERGIIVQLEFWDPWW